MGTKNISLTDEAYERLKSRKEDDESFTDVVLRLTSDDPEDFSDIAAEGVDASFDDLKETRARTEADEGREEVLGG
jgi:predicted CopG family antitoxin